MTKKKNRNFEEDKKMDSNHQQNEKNWDKSNYFPSTSGYSWNKSSGYDDGGQRNSYGNNGEEPSKNFGHSSNSFSNSDSYRRNDGDSQRKVHLNHDFGNSHPGSYHMGISYNRGRAQNVNNSREVGRDNNPSHSGSYHMGSSFNGGRTQNINNSREVGRDNNPSHSKNNNSHYNRDRGQNDKGNPNYSENLQRMDSRKFQQISNSKEHSEAYHMVGKKENSYEGERLNVYDDDRVKKIENKNNDNLQLTNNVNYERQENFFKRLNRASSSDSDIKNIGNSSEHQKPTPLPRTLVSKSDDDDGKGTRKKLKSNRDKDKIDCGYCMNCDKVITKRDLHKDHRVLPCNNAIPELKEKDQDKIVAAIEETNLQLNVETQTKVILNLYENSISPCLSNVFEELKTSNDNNIDKLHQIRDSEMRVMTNSSIDSITDMIKMMDFRSESMNIITQNQKLLSDLKQNSCWLIFSWFKISIGLILQSGVKIFAVMKPQMSASSSYAPFDLYGDHLRLLSFKRGITPKKDALIFPFEPINALFKNEDSKSFMIIENDKQEGQVFIRVNKETFWGQQFLSLCLGDSGPSLRNTRFFRSCGEGKPGHHIWGGDYSKNDGSGGDAFLPWNEPLKQNPEVIVRGLLAARFGHNDKSTIFRIYIKGSDQMRSEDSLTKENFCFGHVEEGMEALEFCASQSDVTKTKIKDAGCFLLLK